jgi:hypothetical protein
MLILKEMVIVLLLKTYCYNGVFCINDIVSEDKQFLSENVTYHCHSIRLGHTHRSAYNLPHAVNYCTNNSVKRKTYGNIEIDN